MKMTFARLLIISFLCRLSFPHRLTYDNLFLLIIPNFQSFFPFISECAKTLYNIGKSDNKHLYVVSNF